MRQDLAIRKIQKIQFSQCYRSDGGAWSHLCCQYAAVVCACPVIEIDHPATQRCKRDWVEAAKSDGLFAAGPNLHFLSADLRAKALPDILSECPAYDPQADTLFLAEGVLMYLLPEEVDRLLSGVRNAVQDTSRCRFIFTFLELQSDGRPNFSHSGHILATWLRWRGEIFRWGIRVSDLPGWLYRQDFALCKTATPEELRACFMKEPLPKQINGDLVCFAERTRSRFER